VALLTSFTDSEQSPGVYLRDDPLLDTQLQNHCELRVPTAEKAAFYLDCALLARGQPPDDAQDDSHLFFTLHVYQYSVAGKGGGEYPLLVSYPHPLYSLESLETKMDVVLCCSCWRAEQVTPDRSRGRWMPRAGAAKEPGRLAAVGVGSCFAGDLQWPKTYSSQVSFLDGESN